MRFADWGFVALVAGCYVAAAIGYWLMPGDTHFSSGFVVARFFSEIAAVVGLVLCVFGTVPLLRSKRRSTDPPVLFWATGACYGLLLMLLIFGKWMHLNFS